MATRTALQSGDSIPAGKALRLRLYALGVVVTVSFLFLMFRTNDSAETAAVHLPLAGGVMLMLCLAGAEFTLYLQRITREREANRVDQERLEQAALERQRAFNHIWQELADHRGETKAPENVLKEISALFEADLVAVWRQGATQGGHHLWGAHPVSNDGAVRLDKVGQASPCFDTLRETKRQLQLTGSADKTARAIAWFCEENGYCHVVLSPVLVRHELVGVLALFYRDKNQTLSSKAREEMQAAANLFLCAF